LATWGKLVEARLCNRRQTANDGLRLAFVKLDLSDAHHLSEVIVRQCDVVFSGWTELTTGRNCHREKYRLGNDE
jgi:hypothetical protein